MSWRPLVGLSSAFGRPVVDLWAAKATATTAAAKAKATTTEATATTAAA